MKRPFLNRWLSCAVVVALCWGVGVCAVSHLSVRKEKTPRTGRKHSLVSPSVSALNDTLRRRYDEFFLESVRQREKGDYAASYELLRHALTLCPDASEALYEAAQLEMRLNADSTARAEAMLRKAASLAPDNYYYQDALADFYLQHNRTDEACTLYEKMAARFPDRSDLLYVLVSLYDRNGQYASLIRTLDKLEEQEGKSENISMEKAKAYSELKQPDKALAEIESLSRQYPSDARYKVMLGDICLQNGRTDEALRTYRNVLAEEPDNAYAHLSLLGYYEAEHMDSLYRAESERVVLNPNIDAQIRAKLMSAMAVRSNTAEGRSDSLRVAELFRRAVAGEQTDVELLRAYTAYLVMNKQPADTLAPVLERLLTAEPENSAVRLQLLEYSLRDGKMERAAVLCQAGSQYSPDETAYFYYGGIALFQLHHNAEAMKMLQAGTRTLTAATSPSLSSDYYALLGDLYHEMGQKEKAYAAYDSALSYKPDNLMCLNNYAYFLSVENIRLEQAADMSKKTVEAEPKNPTFLDTYAWILFRQGRMSEAKIYIDETLKHASPTSENATLYEHAGDIYARLGQTVRAVAYWKQALQVGGGNAVLLKKIKLRKYVIR